MSKGYFDDFWVLAIGSYGNGKGVSIGWKDTKKCRFCGSQEPDVTFKNESHAIPRFLGNKQLILKAECDSCNKYFSSELEDHLDKYTRPFRTFGFVKGRSSIPVYLDKDETRIHAQSDRNIRVIVADDNFVVNDRDKSLAKMTLHRDKFIPERAYKALCKVAVSVIDNEDAVSLFRPAILWIMSKKENNNPFKQLWIYETKIPGGNFTRCHFRLLLRKNPQKLPNAIFIICFGFCMIQVAIPNVFDLDSEPDDAPVPFFDVKRSQEDLERYGVVHQRVIDFTTSEQVLMPEEIIIRYRDYEEFSKPTA